MLSPQALSKLQQEQYQHDQRNHFDIISLPRPDRLKHYGLHFAKYVGRFARGSAELKAPEQTIIDIALISLSASNTLHQKLYEYSFSDRRFEDQDNYLRPYEDAMGRFADACEKIDHLEEFLQTAREANRDIMCWVLLIAREREIDLVRGIQVRRQELAIRPFYIKG